MIILLIFGMIVGNATQFQFKYDYCKEVEFQGDYCSTPKKMNEMSNKE